MTKLKLGPLVEEKPVRLTLELPAPVHHDLVAYAKALAVQTGGTVQSCDKLITPMITQLMATDRGFAKAKRGIQAGSAEG